MKIEKDKALEEHIRKKILEEKYSPDAVIGEIRQKKLPFEVTICTKTLYNYIDDNILAGITNLSLWEKRKRKKKRYKKVQKIGLKNKGAKGIEERPKEANKRLKYGHWEGDCVKGPRKKETGLFVLTERKKREQIMLKIENLTQNSIIKAIDALEDR